MSSIAAPESPPVSFDRKVVKALGWFVLVDVIALAAFVMTLSLSGVRIGVDVQLLIGQPACMPSLLYFWEITPAGAKPKIGSYVVARMPKTEFTIGARPGDRIVKMVMAGPGDEIRVEGTELWINGQHTDRLWLAKSLPGKDVGDFDRSVVLKDGEYFLMGTTHESFDSRYWGPLNREAIIGTATPLL